MPGRQTLNAGQRWLLCFLVLIASLMHLTRIPAVGGLGLMPLTHSQMHREGTGMSSEMETPAPHHSHGATSQTPAMDGLPGHEHAAAPSTSPDLSSSAPNAPPAHSDHNSAAHCPFCLTSAFALEVEAFSLVQYNPTVTLWAALNGLAPALAPIRHADARAPPSRPR